MDSVGCLYGMYTYDDLEPYELEVDPWKDETVSEPKIFKGLVTLRKLLVGIDILTALAHVDLGDTSLVKRLLLNLEHLGFLPHLKEIGGIDECIPSTEDT